jgi:hypothetical protein
MLSCVVVVIRAKSSPKAEFELNVGGRAALQRRLRNYQVTMIGFCSGIGRLDIVIVEAGLVHVVVCGGGHPGQVFPVDYTPEMKNTM